MEFEWDDNKAATNRRKHGVSFEEAETVFDDPKALIFDDLAHSDTEDRRIAIGISNKGRLIVVKPYDSRTGNPTDKCSQSDSS